MGSNKNKTEKFEFIITQNIAPKRQTTMNILDIIKPEHVVGKAKELALTHYGLHIDQSEDDFGHIIDNTISFYDKNGNEVCIVTVNIIKPFIL